MAFENMEQPDLYRVAVEDFAVDVKSTDTTKVILAAMLEDGVTWDQYVAMHPELFVEEEPVVEEVTVKKTTRKARTKQADITPGEAPWLIKMNRENLYFEFRKYKFTKDHPFAVMTAEDADYLLKTEKGFAVASPGEAAEYYDKK